MKMANQQDLDNWRPKSINGKENYKRQTRAAKDGNSYNPESTKLEHCDLTGSRYTNSKTERFLPSIHNKSQGECHRPGSHFGAGNRKGRSKRVLEKKASSKTTQVRQIMPRSFMQFWMRYKPSLAIQSSNISQDIDALSIEVIRQHNEPYVVLPSLRNESK